LAEAVADGVVAFEHPVGEPSLAEILPDIFGGVELRAGRRKVKKRDVDGRFEFACRVPSGFIEEEESVRTARDGPPDFVQMLLHGVHVGAGQNERGAGIAGWTDRAEQVSVGAALVFRLPRARAASGPLVDKTVLLADPHLVLKPDLDRRPARDSL